MELLIEKEKECIFYIDDNIEFSETCGYYCLGPRGLTGCQGPFDSSPPPSPPPPPQYNVRKTVVFTIHPKNSDQNLYESLKNMLEEQKKLDPGIHVFISNPTTSRTRRNECRPGFEAQVKEIEENNAKIQEKFNSLLKELEAIGVYVDGVYPPALKFTDDFYDFDETTDYRVPLTIKCHHGTATHQWLHRKGFLHRYFNW